MNHKVSSVVVIATVAVVLLGLRVAVGQEKYRKQATQGPYRVVISDPVVARASQDDKLYRESEYLSALFNQLDKEGLVPVSTEVLREPGQGQFPIERLLVVCTKR